MRTMAQGSCGSRLPHDKETRIQAVLRAVESGWPRSEHHAKKGPKFSGGVRRGV